MSENYILKEVDFFQYCKKCKNKNVPQDQEPCTYCLDTSARNNTRKPVKFEEEEKTNDRVQRSNN